VRQGKHKGCPLLRLDDERRRLGTTVESGGGLRPIEVARIVGTVGRPCDFDRRFRPLGSHVKRRLEMLLRAIPDGNFPPISVVQVGCCFFVSDGHHRVAAARRLGMEFIDAHITRLSSPPPRCCAGCERRS
jgi:hypothetical protein